MDAHTEIINFAAAMWTAELIDNDTDRPRAERDELILLAATYGPAIDERN